MGKEDESNGNNRHKDVVLKAFIHCEGCSEQVSRCLRGFHGVEQVVVDRENQKVTVKGKVSEAEKVLKRVRKKYSKNVELISPKPKPEKQDNNNKEAEKKVEGLKIVILKTYIHCEGCASDIQRSIEKMKGVVSVDVNKEKSEVVVRGVVEAAQLVQHLNNRLGKHADIINQQDNEDTINIVYSYPPPQYSTHYPHPCQTFSDENVFSCSLM